jgi:hypothetical protein
MDNSETAGSTLEGRDLKCGEFNLGGGFERSTLVEKRVKCDGILPELRSEDDVNEEVRLSDLTIFKTKVTQMASCLLPKNRR